MDPIRIGFVQTLIDLAQNFVNQLPPLLQLILGGLVTLGLLKIIITVSDFFDKKRETKK